MSEIDPLHTVSNLSLPPSATVFHYAHCLFEGLKAYRDQNGKVTLFRPDMNMKRMNTSAQRVAMPVGTISTHSVGWGSDSLSHRHSTGMLPWSSSSSSSVWTSTGFLLSRATVSTFALP